MSDQLNRPQIFISYSWQPTSNKEKVIQLAERLVLDSIHVILDVWDLKEGQDKNLFMEQMVNSEDVKRVLLICNKDYVEKANKRVGGVGIESLIVSNEIYSQAEQIKFIPIIFEYDENNKPYVPTFVNSRIFIDLSDEEIFEANYELLMRNLFDKPISKRPPYGTPPAYILNDDPIFLPTAHKIATIKKVLLEEKKNSILFIQDYYNSFISGLENFRIDEKNLSRIDFDEVVLKGISDITVLRDDFLKFIDIYTSYSVELNLEKLHSFFEKLLEFLLNQDGIGSNTNTVGNIKNDHYRFFIYELFLHFTCIMFEKERFKELAYILHNPFIIHIQRYNETQEFSFTYFKNYVASINDFRKKRLNLNRVSVTADTLKEKATGMIKFTQLQQADIFLYYISLFISDNSYNQRPWFPETSCYDFYNLPIIKKTISQKFFDRIKPLFDVNSKDELLAKVKEIMEKKKDNIERYEYHFPYIDRGLEIDKIATIR